MLVLCLNLFRFEKDLIGKDQSWMGLYKNSDGTGKNLVEMKEIPAGFDRNSMGMEWENYNNKQVKNIWSGTHENIELYKISNSISDKLK